MLRTFLRKETGPNVSFFSRSVAFSSSLSFEFFERARSSEHTHTHPPGESEFVGRGETDALFALRDLITSKDAGSYLWLNVFLVASIQWRESDMLSMEDDGTIYSDERERDNCLRTNRIDSRRRCSCWKWFVVEREKKDKTCLVDSIAYVWSAVSKSILSLIVWWTSRYLTFVIPHTGFLLICKWIPFISQAGQELIEFRDEVNWLSVRWCH